MPLGDYLVGLILFSVTVAAIGGAAILATRTWTPRLRSLERVLAAGLLAVAAVVAIHLVAAAFGILGRVSVPAMAIGLLAATAALTRRAQPADVVEAQPPPVAEPWLSRAIAAIAAGAVALYLLATLAQLATVPALGVDPLNFHLPSIARWLQSGSIWQIDQFLPDQFQGNYPANGNVFELTAVLPWHGDFLIRFVNLPLVGLAWLALVVAGRELGAPLSTSALTAAAVLAIPASTLYVVNTVTPDPFLVATFAAGVAFLVRHARTTATSDLFLAGIGLGLAFGARWYGVSCVVALVGAWLICRLIAERDRRAVVTDLARLSGVIALAGGFWLVRNWIESGNPLFPVEIELFGLTLFDAPPDPARDAVGFALSHYLTDWSAWSDYLLPALASTLGFGAAVIGVGALAAGVTSLRKHEATVTLARRRGRRLHSRLHGHALHGARLRGSPGRGRIEHPLPPPRPAAGGARGRLGNGAPAARTSGCRADLARGCGGWPTPRRRPAFPRPRARCGDHRLGGRRRLGADAPA